MATDDVALAFATSSVKLAVKEPIDSALDSGCWSKSSKFKVFAAASLLSMRSALYNTGQSFHCGSGLLTTSLSYRTLCVPFE